MKCYSLLTFITLFIIFNLVRAEVDGGDDDGFESDWTIVKDRVAKKKSGWEEIKSWFRIPPKTKKNVPKTNQKITRYNRNN